MLEVRKYAVAINNKFDGFVSYCKNNKLLIFFTSIVVILCYGYEITNFTLSIDEELASVYKSRPEAWVKQGRFGVALIKLITKGISIVPFWNTFLAVSILLIAAIIWSKILHNAANCAGKNDIGVILFSVLFVSYPVHMEYMSFNTYNVEVSVGYIICALSILFLSKWCIHRSGKLNLIVGVVLLVFAISIYQSFVLLYIAGVCSYYCLHCMNEVRNDRKIKAGEIILVLFKYVAMLILSLTLYKVINTILQIFYPSTGYVESFMVWGTADFKTVINAVLYDINVLIFGNRIYGGKFLLVTIAVGIMLIFVCMVKNKKQRFIIPICIFMILLAPFLLTIFLGSVTPLRSLQVIPFIIGAIWYIVYYSFKNEIVRKVIILAIALVVIYQSQAMTALSYSDNNRYKQDIAFGNDISDRIEELGQGEVPKQPVVYVGTHSAKASCNLIKSEVLGYSFFEWDGGNNFRIGAFMETIGHNYLRPSQDQIASAKEMAVTLPTWPDRGAVSLKNGIIIVKLS